MWRFAERQAGIISFKKKVSTQDLRKIELIKQNFTVFVHGKVAAIGEHELFKNEFAQSLGLEIVDFNELSGGLELVRAGRIQD